MDLFSRCRAPDRLLVVAALLAALAPSGCGSPAPETLADLPSRHADFDGVRVHWKEVGSGEPVLLFVPGWASDLRIWREQLDHPPADGRLLFVDLPGHGASDAPEGDYPFPWLAESIEAVRVAAGAERLVLVGHSFGAAVARLYAQAHPDRVTALVSVEGHLFPVTSGQDQWDRLVARFRQSDYAENVARMVPQDLDPVTRQELRDMMMATPQRVMVTTLAAFHSPEVLREVPLRAPVLELHGPPSFWNDAYRDKLRGLTPHLDWRSREGASHFLMLQDPEWVAGSVRSFLASLEDSP